MLVHKKGSTTPGNLLLLNQDRFLKLMDAVLDEGSMLSRLNAKVSVNCESPDNSNSVSPSTAAAMAIAASGASGTTHAYVWNGNCRIGEWEHL